VTSRTALIGLLLVGCGSVATGPVGATGAPATASPVSAVTASPAPVAVTDSAYGRIAVRTVAGTKCTVGIHVGPPRYGDLPPATVEGIADPSGNLTLTYAAPHLPAGPGRHEVACGTGTAAADFTIGSAAIPAARFTARIRLAAIDEQILLAGGVTARLDAALVPPRDLDAALLQRTLASEWSAATRGLSRLDLVSAAPADMVITVLPARGTSIHVTAGDGSEAIFLYVADQASALTSDNLVAVALHELGHIWCCRGADASSDGHWGTPVADPLLQGVDRFGLMNHPVQCIVFGPVESCPNRFSERDLRAMGFTQIPPPPRNACVDAKNALLAQLATLKDQLAGAKAAIDATDASLIALSAQIKALEAKYPGGMPPDVYASYSALIDRYNAGVATERTQVASYNALLAHGNGIVDQVNRLLC
jgi:hypothetical protein